jgi:hypothetical protein
MIINKKIKKKLKKKIYSSIAIPLLFKDGAGRIYENFWKLYGR